MPDPIILDDTMSSGGKLRPGVIRHTSAGIFTATLATSRIHKQPRGLQSKYLLCSANGDFLLAIFGCGTSRHFLPLELDTKVRKNFTITEKAPTSN